MNTTTTAVPPLPAKGSQIFISQAVNGGDPKVRVPVIVRDAFLDQMAGKPDARIYVEGFRDPFSWNVLYKFQDAGSANDKQEPATTQVEAVSA